MSPAANSAHSDLTEYQKEALLNLLAHALTQIRIYIEMDCHDEAGMLAHAFERVPSMIYRTKFDWQELDEILSPLDTQLGTPYAVLVGLMKDHQLVLADPAAAETVSQPDAVQNVAVTVLT